MPKLDRIDPISLASNRRATLNAWLKFEPIIVAAFRQHPKPYVYRPTAMSPFSVCSKARDALRGKLAFDYPCEVSNDDLRRWYAEVVFKNDNENVYIGLPKMIQEELKGNAVAPQVPKSLTFPTLSFEEIAAFNILISNNRLAGWTIHVVNPPDISLLSERPNVQLIRRNDGSLVLL